MYFATKSGVSMLHEGLLTPAVERHDAATWQHTLPSLSRKRLMQWKRSLLASAQELVAFHMCHHRSSIFYEVLSKDGGVLTIYEYSLLVKESVKAGLAGLLGGRLQAVG